MCPLSQVDLIKKYGIAVRGHVGQHLLIDPNMQRKITELLEAGEKDLVFEIGPGLGALTRCVLDSGCRMIVLEKDRKFAKILHDELAGTAGKRLKIIQGDILKCDLSKILDENGWKGGKIKVISNLPYYITAPALFYLIERRKLISRAVLTMQKEVAARLVAQPGTKDYGRLSISVRYAAAVRHAFEIPPQCFTPRPEVDSSTVVLDFIDMVPENRFEEEVLTHLVQTGFGQRRKTLFHNLMHDRCFCLTRESLAEMFQSLGFKPTVRGEELLLKDYLALTERLRSHWAAPSGKR